MAKCGKCHRNFQGAARVCKCWQLEARRPDYERINENVPVDRTDRADSGDNVELELLDDDKFFWEYVWSIFETQEDDEALRCEHKASPKGEEEAEPAPVKKTEDEQIQEA